MARLRTGRFQVIDQHLQQVRIGRIRVAEVLQVVRLWNLRLLPAPSNFDSVPARSITSAG
jgi:hypothetical protein